MGIAGETSISDMDVTMKNAIDNFRGNNT